MIHLLTTSALLEGHPAGMELGGGGRAFLLFSLQTAGDSQAAFHAAEQPTDLSSVPQCREAHPYCLSKA